MIYLDYAATAPVGQAAIQALIEACSFPGNANSKHALGLAASNNVETARSKIIELLGLDTEQYELVPTSGATESNNLALQGVFIKGAGQCRNHIITTQLEHASVIATLGSLQRSGAEIEFVRLQPDGTVDLEHLLSLIQNKTILVSIGTVQSETGVRQPIETISRLLKERFPTVLLHTDATQAVGKITVDYAGVDLLSFSGHKFSCCKGIGGLIKKKQLALMPLLRGGSSTTKFRSGTPCSELLPAMNAALEDTLNDFTTKTAKLRQLNAYLRRELMCLPRVILNSPARAVPQIVNFSVIGTQSELLQQFLSDKGIYISTRTACAAHSHLSTAVLQLTGDEARAGSSVRVSFGYQTEMAELETLVKAVAEFIGGIPACK